ncbi:MAG: hypothetical protein ACTHJ8_08765 [Mucilaginibacter sp.]
MMNTQQAFAGGADAQQDFLAGKVNLFLFDLKNEANEHGFKAGESWNIRLVTEEEIIRLKRQYQPVISVRLQSEGLLKVYLKVKSRLEQPLSKEDMALTADQLTRNEKRHMAAFPERYIRN